MNSYFELTDTPGQRRDRKSTRLNSSHGYISYAVFCLKKKTSSNSRSTTPHSPTYLFTLAPLLLRLPTLNPNFITRHSYHDRRCTSCTPTADSFPVHY